MLGEIARIADGARSTSETAFKTHAMRGMLRAVRKECEAALQDFEAADAISLPRTPETAYNLFNVRSWTGEALNCLGRHADAEALYARLLADESDAEIVGPALLGYARLGYAKALQQLGRIDPAREQISRALHTLETGIGAADAFTVGQALVVAGVFYADIGDYDTARKHLIRGRELLLPVGERQEKALEALRVLGTIDYVTQRNDEAIEKLRAAREGLIAVFGEQSPDAQGASYWLAAALADAGQRQEAAAYAAGLDASALQAALGGTGWATRLDALRTKIAPPE